MKKNQKIFTISVVAFLLLFAGHSFAATYTIDPDNAGYHYAGFVRAPNGGSAQINFGKFTTATSDDITISGEALHGFAWSPVVGWIVMNCADTTSGCTTSNQDFKVAVSDAGVLSGYAWGQQTGWINFGPFVNNSTPQVQIASNGNFAGTNGATAGYAWSEAYGWIVFDCSSSTTCAHTDYVPVATVVTTTDNRGTLSGGSKPVVLEQPPASVPPNVPSSVNTTTTTTTIHRAPPQQVPVTVSSSSIPTDLDQPSSAPSRVGPTSGPTMGGSMPTKNVSTPDAHNGPTKSILGIVALILILMLLLAFF